MEQNSVTVAIQIFSPIYITKYPENVINVRLLMVNGNNELIECSKLRKDQLYELFNVLKHDKVWLVGMAHQGNCIKMPMYLEFEILHIGNGVPVLPDMVQYGSTHIPPPPRNDQMKDIEIM